MASWLEDCGKDLRHAVRGLGANPLFAIVAVLTLALGIGANTAIFSVMNAVVMRALPVRDAKQIVLLRTEPGQPNGASNTGDSASSFSEYVFEQLRQDHRAFSDVMAYVPMGYNKIPVHSRSGFGKLRARWCAGIFYGAGRGRGVRAAARAGR